MLSQPPGISQEIGVKSGIFLNFQAYYMERRTVGSYLYPYYRINKHEFYTGLIYPFFGVYGAGGDLDQHLGFVAGYNFYFFKIHRRFNIYLHFEFQYLVYSGEVFSGDKYGTTYFEIERYFNNIVGVGFIGFLDKNQRVGISWSWGFNFSKNTYDFFQDYLNANLGITIKIASFEKGK